MKITLRQLELFVKMVETESLSQAAMQICISQPAASLALKSLEKQLKHALFDRVGKRLVINEEGRLLYPKASQLIEEAQQAENIFNDKQKKTRTVIRVGMSMTIGDYIAPIYFKKFISSYPHIQIIQTIANSENIVHLLERFQLDIAFIEAEYRSELLKIQPWKSDEMIIFSAPTHPFAKKKEISKDDLEQAHWIMRERGSGTRAILEKHIKVKNITMEVSSTTALKNIVSYGLGIGCISQAALKKELENKQLIKLNVKNLILKRNLYSIIHAEKYLNSGLQSFINILNENLD